MLAINIDVQYVKEGKNRSANIGKLLAFDEPNGEGGATVKTCRVLKATGITKHFDDSTIPFNTGVFWERLSKATRFYVCFTGMDVKAFDSQQLAKVYVRQFVASIAAQSRDGVDADNEAEYERLLEAIGSEIKAVFFNKVQMSICAERFITRCSKEQIVTFCEVERCIGQRGALAAVIYEYLMKKGAFASTDKETSRIIGTVAHSYAEEVIKGAFFSLEEVAEAFDKASGRLLTGKPNGGTSSVPAKPKFSLFGRIK